MALSIRIYNAHPAFRFPIHRLKKCVCALLRAEAPAKPAPSVNIILTEDDAVRELNRSFRKKNKPTDVLSFNFDDPDLLGEIYISLDTAAQQAAENDLSLEQELKRLIVHGLFHLMGHDHHRKKERIRMERLEARYL
ncbi:MAG: rRNA maturation RNase YbeY [Fibrobacterota bacterium]